MRLPATLALVGVLVLLWLLGALLSPANEPDGVLAMSVADVILQHIRPWAYLTAGFYHPHFLQLVLVVPLVIPLAMRVEQELGSMGVLRLLLFVNILASAVLFVQLFGIYIVFRDAVYLHSSMSGFSGGIAALLVAYMQPRTRSPSAFVPGIKLRYYPLLFTLLCSIGSLIAVGTTSTALKVSLLGAGPYAWLGMYLGWFYLRFLHKNADDSVGDVSIDFEFAVLLPHVCRKIVGPIAAFCYSVVQLCGFFKTRAAKAQTLPIASGGQKDPIAERRKARALKALDEKLARLANAPSSTADTADSAPFLSESS